MGEVANSGKRGSLWLVALAGAMLFAAGLLVYRAGSWGIDAAGAAFLVSPSDTGFLFASAVSFVGSTVVTIVVLVVLVAIAWFKGRAREAYVAAAGVLVAQVLDALLKLGFDRSRPPYALVAEDPWSFPSGHATRAAALCVVAAWFAWRAGSPRARFVGMLGVAWALVVGWSRLALGVHYVSDVLGGWGTGIIGAAGGILAAERLVDPVLARLPPLVAGPRPRRS